MLKMENNTKAFEVLSLEDSVMDFEIIQDQLSNSGLPIAMDHVMNESDFLNAITGKKYDIILADYSLPGFDAFGALEHCVRICPDVPFICVSGSIGEITAIELLKKGAVDYVLKDRMERLPFAFKRALEEAGHLERRFYPHHAGTPQAHRADDPPEGL